MDLTLKDIQRCLNDGSEAVARKESLVATASEYPYFTLLRQAVFRASEADAPAVFLQSCFPEWTRLLLQGECLVMPLAQRAAIAEPVQEEAQVREEEPVLHAAIDHFIADCAELKPQRTEYVVDIASSIRLDEDIATETLARVYAAQRMYKKAMSVYRKLILKYPEKSDYFALQIETLEQELI